MGNILIRPIRRPLGLLLLFIGIAGLLLPIMPGWPFIIPSIILLGRRDPLLRWLHVQVRRFLRWLRRQRRGWLRALGMRLHAEYIRTREIVLPMLIATERAFERSLGIS
jgi:uncharacterized membrane protein YbaN (DUF454 family)